MSKVAVITDSNSGIRQSESADLGVFVLPMPFDIDGKAYLEDINLTQDQFYEKLLAGADASTSQPAPGDVTDLWDKVLADHDEIVYIPMSSGLSGSCATATILAQDYDGRVQVVNNQRISVTQRQSALDAVRLAKEGKSAAQIKEILEATKFDSSIYIMMSTLKYLKKGGRITPAAAALGTLLRLKPVLQIQGEKLDAFAKARTVRQAKNIMINAVKKNMAEKYDHPLSDDEVIISGAWTPGTDEKEWIEEVKKTFPNNDIYMQPLALSIACHIGDGALALTVTRKLKD